MTGFVSDRMEKGTVQPIIVDTKETLAIAERPIMRMNKKALEEGDR